jgi:hypothetical protein
MFMSLRTQIAKQPLLLAVAALVAFIGFQTRDAQADDAPPFTAKQRSHWAYFPVARPAIPQVDNSARIRTPVDAFVLARLQREGLSLSPAAGRRELIRRLKFDLLGLPPTVDEIEQFLADDSPDAYERLVERFLANPHYGETWGRHWLDLVRFAETAGFNADPARPLAYKYRDYVIRAFNGDKPYRQFVAEQIAGDEVAPENVDAWVATGYLRMWPDESNASNVLLARQDALNDLTGNVSSVFLASSLGCAQCHDHKFDPLLQDDFYQLQAFLVGATWTDRVAVGTAEQLEIYRKQMDEWLRETASVRRDLHSIEQSAEIKASYVKRLKFPKVVLDAIDTAELQRSAFQKQLAFWSERQIEVSEKQLLAKMSEVDQKRRVELKQQLAKLVKQKPKPPASTAAMACVELPSGVPKTELLAGGSYSDPIAEVEPAVFTVVNANRKIDVKISPPHAGTSGRRSALAKWMTDPGNPLTARVMVNRIWQGHFGRGLVENANDFGTRTAPPSHPELLDWLASEFVARDWSMKSLHRLIVCSAVYRQANFRREPSSESVQAEQVDASNRLYWHFPRRRLSAEAIRDALLSVSGDRSEGMYGPGVRPDLPPNYSSREKWTVSKNIADRQRRSVYIYSKRNLPYPLLKAFDFPDMHESCARRAETTVAPQSLMLLNSEMVTGYAARMAGRLMTDVGTADLPKLIDAAYETAFGRSPDEDERSAAVAFIGQQQTLTGAKSPEKAIAAAFGDFCHALLNSNEFLYVE